MNSLSPCPDRPNCVTSQVAVESGHYVKPFPVIKSAEEDLKRLAAIIRSFPRTEIVKESSDYLHAEFTSKVFRFTDDVEFLVNRQKSVIEVRSASRIGYGDFGVNRKRVEELRALYLKGEDNEE